MFLKHNIGKTKLIDMVGKVHSSYYRKPSTGKKERQCRYFKAKVLEDHKFDGTNDTLKKAIAGEQTIVITDKSTSYVDITDYVELHITK